MMSSGIVTTRQMMAANATFGVRGIVTSCRFTSNNVKIAVVEIRVTQYKKTKSRVDNRLGVTANRIMTIQAKNAQMGSCIVIYLSMPYIYIGMTEPSCVLAF